MTVYNDKTRMASYREDTLAHSNLIAGHRSIKSEQMRLVAGNLTAGAVVGRLLGTVTPAAVAGNTSGSGTIASATLGAGAKPGVYRVICMEPASNAGAFLVEDPDGLIVGRATVAVAFAGPVNFTITDATDFVVGDQFTITVALDDINVKLAATAATDGSQAPYGILAHDADASTDEVLVQVYTYGDFDETALSFGTGHDADTVRDALRARGIHLVSVLPN